MPLGPRATLGRWPVFQREEAQLANCISILCNNGFSPGQTDILDVVQQYVQKTTLLRHSVMTLLAHLCRMTRMLVLFFSMFGNYLQFCLSVKFLYSFTTFLSSTSFELRLVVIMLDSCE